MIEEMKGGIEHNVKDIADKMMGNLAKQATDVDNKVFVMYCYSDDKGIDYTLKAVPTDPLLKDEFMFVAIQNPTEQTL